MQTRTGSNAGTAGDPEPEAQRALEAARAAFNEADGLAEASDAGSRGALAYCRSATEGSGITWQARSILQHARTQGLVVSRQDLFAETGSGLDPDLPERRRLSAVVAQGGCSIVLVASLDRLSRNPAQVAALIDEFGRHGTKVVAVSRAPISAPDLR